MPQGEDACQLEGEVRGADAGGVSRRQDPGPAPHDGLRSPWRAGPDSRHRGVSVVSAGEGIQNGLRVGREPVVGLVIVAGDADGDLLQRSQGAHDPADAEPGGVL